MSNSTKATNSAIARDLPVWKINVLHVPAAENDPIRLAVTDDDRIRDIKIALEESPDQMAYAMELICKGVRLENEIRLSHYGIEKNDHIWVVIRRNAKPPTDSPHEFHLGV